MPIIQPITLCGSKQLRRAEIRACLQTWSRLEGVAPFVILDDGTLDERDVAELSGYGHVIRRPDADEQVIHGTRAYPNLTHLRQKCFYFRKIIDPVFACPQADYLLWVDTDVYLAERCALSPPEHDFVYGVDDASCYGGSWRAALRHPMLLGLNAGFLLFARHVIDLPLLERLTERYFLPLSPPFRPIMEQTAWSILGARVKAAVFSGHDYRIINGLDKRTIEEHRDNRIKWWSPNKLLTDAESARALLEGVAVIHFAGSGRVMLQQLGASMDSTCTNGSDIRNLRCIGANPSGGFDRVLLASRMAVSQITWRRRIKQSAQRSRAQLVPPMH